MGPSQRLHDLECLFTLHSSTVLFVYSGRGIHCTVLYPASYIQPYNTIFPYFQSCSNITSNSGEAIYISIYSHYTSGLLFLSLFCLLSFFFVWCGSCVHISVNLYFSSSPKIQKFTIFKIKTCHLSFHIPFKFKLSLLNIKTYSVFFFFFR